MLLLWILFVICDSCLSLLYCLVCSLQTCDHLLGKADLLALLCVMFSCVFDTFPCVILDQVRYLIVSIPDLCLLPYFFKACLVYLFTFTDVTTPYCLYDIIPNRMDIIHQSDCFQRINSMRDYVFKYTDVTL